MKTLGKYVVKITPLEIRNIRKQEYNPFKSKLFSNQYSKIIKKIKDENIVQLRISFAKVEPIKIPSNWKADMEIKGVMTTNPHNPNINSLSVLISVKIEIR